MFETRGLTVRYGGHTALDDFHLTACRGEVTGLIGPNGAGKTTLFDAVCGFVAPAAGRVFIGGADITRLAPHLRARRGLGRTYQHLRLFQGLTVWENILTGAELAGVPDALAVARAALDRLGLGPLAARMAGSLPGGLGRLVELARALAAQPAVLLLDEPTAGLDDDETGRLAAALPALADERAILMVEHDTALVFAVCRRVAVVASGKKIADGPAPEVRRDPVVREAYLGSGSLA